MIERYTNFGQTTLIGPVNSTQTTITVNNASKFPTQGQFRVIIDSEIMVVTSVSGNVFTVTRAGELTTAASHASNAIVNHDLTSGALAQIRSDMYNYDAYANGTVDRAGRILLSSDSSIFRHDDGSTLLGRDGLWQLTPPDITSTFAVFNQGTATVDSTLGYPFIATPLSNANNWRIFKKSAPSTPYKAKICLIPFCPLLATLRCGFGFRESASAKMESIEWAYSSSTAVINCNSWVTIASINASRAIYYPEYGKCYPNWFHIRNDGTTLYMGFSSDGYNPYEFCSFAKNNWFNIGPNEIWFGVNSNDATGSGAGSFLHYEEA